MTMTTIRKGDEFHVNGEAYIIDGIVDDDVYVERVRDNKLTKYSLSEAQQLVEDSVRKGWYAGPWPIRIESEVFADEYPFEDELLKLGVSEEYRNMFKHTLSSITLCLDLHQNGRAVIKSINGVDIKEHINTR